jgi:hypothetical protein
MIQDCFTQAQGLQQRIDIKCDDIQRNNTRQNNLWFVTAEQYLNERILKSVKMLNVMAPWDI